MGQLAGRPFQAKLERTSLLACWLILAPVGVSAQAAETPTPAEPQFAIAIFVADGNTVLPDATVAAILQAHTGPERRFADIEAARRALEAAYLQAGYSTVRVTLPEQEVSGGTVRLRVQEMRLGRVELLAAQHHDFDNVGASLPGLQADQVPNTTAIAESLRLANENPSKQTYLLLKPAATGSHVDALIRLEDEKPWKVFTTADNTGTVDTGRTRIGIGYQHANLFNRDHVATVQYVSSAEKPNDVRVFGFGYRLPLYAQADALDLYAGYSDVDSGTVAGLFNVSGKGSILGLRYTYNFAKNSSVENKLAAGVDYRAYENDIDLSGTQLGNEVTVHPVNLTWSSLWKNERAQLGGYLSWLKNLPGGGKGRDSDFAAARNGADANYHLTRAGGSASQQILADWQLRLSADGQYSDEALVPGEQFGIGGQDSVRGFPERAISGDRGWRGGIELFTPDLGELTGISEARLRASIFFESGHIDRLQALPGEVVSEGIASTGLGLRLGVGKALSVRLDYGHVLDGGGSVLKSDHKLHGSVAYVF